MFKQVYRLDSKNFLVETLVVEFDKEGNPIDKLESNIIITSPPHQIYKPKWTGTEWVEGATQEEIDGITKPPDSPLTDTQILGQQMTERELESMEQGQQITDLELRLLIVEMGANQ
ncbi:hypothetical protein NST63_17925 [Heyndrickxia sp. FSL W8-0496]|uniref:hypothetical protein n=1 Tax=Heyndrickxia sp. FSL W8-0496 TaxID=2954702 RepID=UPI0030F4C91C